LEREARRSRPSGHIGEAIRQFLRDSGLQGSASHERVFRAWTAAAGPAWSAQAVPVSFRSGQLTVEVASSVHLHELRSFKGESYRARANASLGGDVIRKVAFKLRG